MAIYRLKRKLFAAPRNQQPRPRQNQQRINRAYNRGFQNGQKQNQATINSLTQKTTDLTNQVKSLTESNQELQNNPGMGTGLALGVGGTMAGIVGLGKYKQKKEEEEQYQPQISAY